MPDDADRNAGNHPELGADRDRNAEDRDRIAEDRDRRAEDHDQAADARDASAGLRDKRAEAREQAAGAVELGASTDRRAALRDRQGGAGDRAQSVQDRQASAADRSDSARDRAAASIDALTGAHRRDAGLRELEREVARAQRLKRPLTLAFVDVDHLKTTNDTLGHAAGDQLLSSTADTIRTRLRSYDLIIRFGGDEFVCALLDMTVAGAAERFALVSADLRSKQASVTVGLAQLESDDAPQDVLARADHALYAERQRQRSAGA